jgi:hypothetical protein
MDDAVSEDAARTSLIKQVFIEPIRTVVVVDDEFPTIDVLVQKELKQSDKSWNQADLERVKQMLDFARSKDRPWLVDIHDAEKIKLDAEARIAPYLDHSDLMVLDYHLQGDDGTGEACISILRQLALNGHHNLVIIYTKGQSGDTRRVLDEIAVSLSVPDPRLGSNAELTAKIGALVDEWNDSEEGFREKLLEQVPLSLYLRLRMKATYGSFLAMEESAVLKDLLRGKTGGKTSVQLKDIIDWICLQRQDTQAKAFSKSELGHVHLGESSDAGWLRTDRMFLTVLSKNEKPSVFEERLTNALLDSFPSPHRLLMARMRATIDEQGSKAEIAVLSDKAVQTAWLGDFLDKEPTDEHSAIWSSVHRHWEALGDQLRANLIAFGAEVRKAFLPLGSEVFSKCGLKESDLGQEETILSYNRFISTKSLDRSHLTTGHIFKLGEIYWICLSPACDMVPGQKTEGWNSRLEASKPFVAFRLWSVSARLAAGSATTNNFVFLDIEGRMQAFSIYKDGSVRNNPEWEQMFASNQARFHGDNNITITTTISAEGNLKHQPQEATVIAQLRAEYALNLLQRVGSYLFRPGLGMHFKSRQDPP